MPGKDIIVIRASAGGVEALKVLFGEMSANLPASIFIVMHTSPYSPSILPEILSRSGALPASHAVDGE